VSKDEQQLRRKLDQRCAAVLGVPQVDASQPHIQLQYTAGDASEEVVGTLHTAGLHVDLNHQNERRFATIVLYLNTLPKGGGGETVFPCATPEGEDVAHHVTTATHVLARADHRATAEACHIDTVDGELVVEELAEVSRAAAALLEAAEGQAALRIRPRKGLAALFFHVTTPEGDFDKRSWHGGAAVGAKVTDTAHGHVQGFPRR